MQPSRQNLANPKVIVIEIFGGILPATVALHKCGLSPVTFFSEIANDPIEVAKAHWPEAISIGDMRTLNMEWIDGVVSTCPDALIWLTGGIPCKDVSKLNKNRNGASGQHSGLYLEAKKILEYVRSKTDNVVFSFECGPNGRLR